MRVTYFDGLEIKLQQTLFWISPFFIFIFIILFVIFVARKNIKSEMVSIGISLVFIINRTLHGCLKIQNFSSRVENIYSAWPCKTLFIYSYLFLTNFTFYFFFTENIIIIYLVVVHVYTNNRNSITQNTFTTKMRVSHRCTTTLQKINNGEISAFSYFRGSRAILADHRLYFE